MSGRLIIERPKTTINMHAFCLVNFDLSPVSFFLSSRKTTDVSGLADILCSSPNYMVLTCSVRVREEGKEWNVGRWHRVERAIYTVDYIKQNLELKCLPGNLLFIYQCRKQNSKTIMHQGEIDRHTWVLVFAKGLYCVMVILHFKIVTTQFSRSWVLVFAQVLYCVMVLFNFKIVRT